MKLKEPGADNNLQCRLAIGLLDSIIAGHLTRKQRIVLIASLNGMPLQEIAARMNISKSAICRLNSDTRIQIKRYLKERSLNLDELKSAFERKEERRDEIPTS